MVHASNVNGMAQDANKIDSHQLRTSEAVASADITSNLHNDSILSTTNYTKAVEHKTQPSFKTTVYGSVSSDEKPKSGNINSFYTWNMTYLVYKRLTYITSKLYMFTSVVLCMQIFLSIRLPFLKTSGFFCTSLRVSVQARY